MEEDIGGFKDAAQASDHASPDQASIDALWHSLHRDIRRQGTDAHLAEDVAQEAWLRTLRRPPKGSQFLKPWLRVVAMRVLAELMGKDRSRIGRERRVARLEAAEVQEVASEDSRVIRLAEELPSPYREVVRLRYVEDLEIEEIARQFGIMPGTVRSQLKRGLDRLRVRLESSEEAGEHDSGTRRSKRSLLAWLGIRRRGAEASSASGGPGGALPDVSCSPHSWLGPGAPGEIFRWWSRGSRTTRLERPLTLR
jgi:RNA polymerase sigma-70 factor (ECF subfamily)